MHRLSHFMLSALILGGMCFQVMAQEAEIEVIEVEPGVQLKRKITKSKKSEKKARRIIRLKKGDSERVIELNVDNESGKNQVIDLGNGSKAIIRIDSDDEEDAFTFFDMEEQEPKTKTWAWSHQGGLQGLKKELSQLEMGDLGELGNNLEALGFAELKDHAEGLKEHLEDLEIEIDGAPMGLMELVGPKGLNLDRIMGANNLRIHVGKHDMRIPVGMGKTLWRLVTKGEWDERCPCCPCKSKKSKKRKSSSREWFMDGQERNYPGTVHGNKTKQEKSKRFHFFSPSTETKKSKTQTHGYFKSKTPPVFARQVGPEKKKPTLRWNANPHAPKKKGKKASTFKFSTEGEKAKKSNRKKLRVLRRSAEDKKSQALLRLLKEREEHHYDDDDDDLEEALEDLEEQLEELRRQLRELKKRI